MLWKTIFTFVSLGAILTAEEIRTATGTVTSKLVKHPSIYTQYPAGKREGFHGPTQIPLAESVVFEIKVNGITDKLRYETNAVEARAFEVGQKVRIEYVRRSMLPFKAKAYVREMKPVLDKCNTKD